MKSIPDHPLLTGLKEYINDPKLQFHMPAHVAGNAIAPELKDLFGTNIFKSDLTELDELDNLYQPSGIIKLSQEKIADIYETACSFILVNGSSSGIIALILSSVKQDEQILVARNCHISVINGIILAGANPVWLMPEWLTEWELFGQVTPDLIEQKLTENNNIKAVIITNPTYEGVVSDVKSISNVCKKHDTILIVDEAHGGHWKFNPNLPNSSVELGTDAVIQSTHKTCGSLTQSSILHLPHNSKMDPAIVQQNLKLIQTTSPSYLLMTSVDSAIYYINSNDGRLLLNKTVDISINLKNKLLKVPNLKILSNYIDSESDPTKLFVQISGYSGLGLAELIEQNYNIAVESCNNIGVLFLIGIGNTTDQTDYLFYILEKIAVKSNKLNDSKNIKRHSSPKEPIIKLNLRQAFFSPSRKICLKDAIGKLARFPMTKCPPGISIMLPGEEITYEHLSYLSPDELIDVLV